MTDYWNERDPLVTHETAEGSFFEPHKKAPWWDRTLCVLIGHNWERVTGKVNRCHRCSMWHHHYGKAK